ncbi:MAG: MXAN_5187 C-terminal domain-containing protein [Acidobacteriota bacterium]
MDLDKELADLDLSITRLKLDYERFFSGGQKVPPERERDRVAAMIKRLNATSMQNFSQRYLFQVLMTRFYTYSELWNRQMRAREEGISLTGIVPHARPAPAAAAAPPVRPTEYSAVIGSPDHGQPISTLYGQFMELRSQTGEPADKVSPQAFEKLIQSQYKQLTQKFGASAVEFRLSIKDGKVQLRAKAIETK